MNQAVLNRTGREEKREWGMKKLRFCDVSQNWAGNAVYHGKILFQN